MGLPDDEYGGSELPDSTSEGEGETDLSRWMSQGVAERCARARASGAGDASGGSVRLPAAEGRGARGGAKKAAEKKGRAAPRAGSRRGAKRRRRKKKGARTKERREEEKAAAVLQSLRQNGYGNRAPPRSFPGVEGLSRVDPRDCRRPARAQAPLDGTRASADGFPTRLLVPACTRRAASNFPCAERSRVGWFPVSRVPDK